MSATAESSQMWKQYTGYEEKDHLLGYGITMLRIYFYHCFSIKYKIQEITSAYEIYLGA